MTGYQAFAGRLTALYGLFPVIPDVTHPADVLVRETVLNEPLARWWIIQMSRSNPRLHANLTHTLLRVGLDDFARFARS